MSRPVIIRNGSNSVINVKDKSEKLIRFGNEYHIYMSSLDIPTFDISVDDYGGVVTIKNVPLGIIGVPSSVTGDGSIRVASIFNMDYNNPETGSTDCIALYCPSLAYAEYVNLFTGPSIQANHYSGTFVDGFHDYNVLIQLSTETLGTSWKTLSTVPTRSSKYEGYSPAAMCCWRYNPISSVIDTLGYWYLPSKHELIEEASHKDKVNSGFSSVYSMGYGIGRIPYSQTRNDWKTYWTSRYASIQTSWGGNCIKHRVYDNADVTLYYGTANDPGIAQAWCKLIKSNGKWTLDPNYHID